MNSAQLNKPAQPYWSQQVADVMATLGTSPQGLSTREATERLRRYGPNAVADQAELTAPRLLLRQFESPLVLILLFGAIVSLFLRDWVDASIILMIVLGSTLLGFTQEYRASAAIAGLRSRLALTAKVMRDNALRTVPAATIVPGDVIVLSAGNLVPADGLIIAANDFLVTEASLTGESFPVEKQPGIVAADAPLSARFNSVFLGTSVRSGAANVLVAETGRRTVFGKIAAQLGAQPAETEFAHGVRQFGYLLIRIMIIMVLFVLTINQALQRPIVESLLFAVALAVGLSPELLPAIVSVTLSAGARAMAQRGVIVRRLEAIENLGCMDVLCTDKTGTLTEGVMALSGAVDADGRASDEVRRFAFLNAAFETGIENPLDAAIVAAGERAGFTTAGHRKVDEIPYDFLRKRLTIVIAKEEEHWIITKGAFDSVLAICATVSRHDIEIPLDKAEHAKLQAYYRQKGTEGFRVLAVATKRVAVKERYDHSDESKMSFVGFLLFTDPPKPQVEKTIRDLAALGIRIKIISGDNRYVTAHLAETVGLNPKALLTGGKIAKLKDESLWHLAERTDFFVEVDPQQKERIVRALQHSGHSVGYLGDGINDAPALHAADVGISVDQAVDVARESADIILLQPDLDVLRRGVEDGRRTFTNTLKYICITVSANFGNMVSMALATPFLPFLPLAAKQILLNNFLSSLPALTISTDNVDTEKLAHAQRWHVRDIHSFMIIFGLLSSAFDFVTFAVLLYGFGADEMTFRTSWFVESLLTQLAVMLILRTQRPALRSAPSGLLLWTTFAVGAIALVLPYFGAPALMFDFLPLSAPLLGALLLIVIVYVLLTETIKLRFFAKHDYASENRAV